MTELSFPWYVSCAIFLFPSVTKPSVSIYVLEMPLKLTVTIAYKSHTKAWPLNPQGDPWDSKHVVFPLAWRLTQMLNMRTKQAVNLYTGRHRVTYQCDWLFRLVSDQILLLKKCNNITCIHIPHVFMFEGLHACVCSPGRVGRNPWGVLLGVMPLTMQSNRKLICSPSEQDKKKTPAPRRLMRERVTYDG